MATFCHTDTCMTHYFTEVATHLLVDGFRITCSPMLLINLYSTRVIPVRKKDSLYITSYLHIFCPTKYSTSNSGFLTAVTHWPNVTHWLNKDDVANCTLLYQMLCTNSIQRLGFWIWDCFKSWISPVEERPQLFRTQTAQSRTRTWTSAQKLYNTLQILHHTRHRPALQWQVHSYSFKKL